MRYYAVGSPPQVRGKPGRHQQYLDAAWITPAGAGKTACSVPSSASSRDHPRRCGENKIEAEWNLPELEDHPRRCGENLYFRCQQRIHRGSPPQVRGKLSKSTIASANRRITPAGAGKTGIEQLLEIDNGDHPRRCGENYHLYR